MYSENNEEKIISDFFQGKTGNFLDIGAFNGVNFSNTLHLLELNWNGILIEPSFLNFNQMQINFDLKNISKDQYKLINCAIVPDYFKKNIVFYEGVHDEENGFASAGSSFYKDELEFKNSLVKINTINVSIINTTKLFDLIDFNFDFINIDVEGLNYELLLSIDWSKFKKLKLICIEQDVSLEKYVRFMHHFDFELFCTEQQNIFFKKIIN